MSKVLGIDLGTTNSAMAFMDGSDLVLPAGIELGLHQAELAFATIGGKMAEETDNKPAAAAAPAAGAPAAGATPAAAPAKK